MREVVPPIVAKSMVRIIKEMSVVRRVVIRFCKSTSLDNLRKDDLSNRNGRGLLFRVITVGHRHELLRLHMSGHTTLWIVSSTCVYGRMLRQIPAQAIAGGSDWLPLRKIIEKIDCNDRDCLGQIFCFEVGLYPTMLKYQVNIEFFRPKNKKSESHSQLIVLLVCPV